MTVGYLPLGRDVAIQVGAVVDNRRLQRCTRQMLEEYEGPEVIGNIFEDAWEGLKDVAKKITQSSVLRKIANTLTDPRFQALVSVVPGLGPLAAHGTAQVGAAWNGLRAATASAKGFPDLAANISALSGQQAAALGVGPDAFNAAQAFGASLAVDPQALATLQQQVPGGLDSILRTYSAPPLPTPSHLPAGVSVPTQRVSAAPLIKGKPLTPAQVQSLARPRPSAIVTPQAASRGVVQVTEEQARHLAKPSDFKAPLPRGSYGWAAGLLKQYLMKNQHNPAAWGAYGPAGAVVRFQRFASLPVTGVVDPATIDRLATAGSPIPPPAFKLPGAA